MPKHFLVSSRLFACVEIFSKSFKSFPLTLWKFHFNGPFSMLLFLKKSLFVMTINKLKVILSWFSLVGNSLLIVYRINLKRNKNILCFLKRMIADLWCVEISQFANLLNLKFKKTFKRLQKICTNWGQFYNWGQLFRQFQR